MPLRQITGYLYLAFALALFLGETVYVLAAGASRTGEDLLFNSLIPNFGLALAGGAAGFALLRYKGRPCLWFALFVAGLGLFKFFLWRLLLTGRLPRMDIMFGGPPWVVLMDLATRVLLPVMFVLSAILLFERTRAPAEAPKPVDVTRPAPVFGVLSLVFSVPPIVSALMLNASGGNRNGVGDLLGLMVMVSYTAWFLGFISVMAAFIRWEKRPILPLLGFAANVSPMLFLAFNWASGDTGSLILGVLACAACAILSLMARERGRTWSLLAAIPAAFMLFGMVTPLLRFLLERMR